MGFRGLLFWKVPEPKSAKSRMHVDLASRNPDEEIERLVGIGRADAARGARATERAGRSCSTPRATNSASARSCVPPFGGARSFWRSVPPTALADRRPAVSPREWGTRPMRGTSSAADSCGCRLVADHIRLASAGCSRSPSPARPRQEGLDFCSLEPRALGASPNQVGWALVVAQLLPARARRDSRAPRRRRARMTRSGRHGSTVPSAPALLGVLIVTLLVVALLTSIPARIGARKPVAGILQSELA